MNRKTLEAMGLTKEQIDQIMQENGADIEGAKAALNTQITELKQERDGLKTQVSERDTQLEGLKKNAGKVEDLEKQISDLQEANKASDAAHKAELKQLRIDNAVDRALSAAGAKNAKAVRALLNLEKAELADDGTVKGLSDQITALQKAEDSSFLFQTQTAAKPPKIKGAQPGQSSYDSPAEASVTREQLAKMSYSEVSALKSSSPAAFAQVSGAGTAAPAASGQ